MPFTADELANINASALENYIDRGEVWKQNVQNKPLLEALNRSAGRFSGGNENVSFAVGPGQGGGSLQGYTGNDQVAYYNPANTRRVRFPWKEHHIGISVSHTELKIDGVDVLETDASQDTRRVDGREAHALAGLLDEKNELLGEDYTFSLDRLLHGDGSTDVKALAGIQALVFDNPEVGSTGGLSRTSYSWYRNRAATATYGLASGQGAVSSSAANGGALIAFLDTEIRQLGRYRRGQTRWHWFAGSDFIDAYKSELRANGYYNMSMSSDRTVPDGSMQDPRHAGRQIVYDPTLDDLGLTKRCYVLDLGRRGIRLLYMDGQRMKRHNPARPYDRYVMYNGITCTAVLVAKQLNTSAVYEIA